MNVVGVDQLDEMIGDVFYASLDLLGPLATPFQIVRVIDEVLRRVAARVGLTGHSSPPTDTDHRPRLYGQAWVFTSGPRYAAFPDATVPILMLSLHGRRWSEDASINWSITGATTPRREGTIRLRPV
jgi:hypothetical protein